MLSDEEKKVEGDIKMNSIDILEKMKIVNGKIENVTPIDAIFAISTLIAENKELKERNKRQQENLKITNKKIAAQRGQLMMLNKAYIPKSKVEEKIEELEKGDKNTFIRGEKILVLQSLLGKE